MIRALKRGRWRCFRNLPVFWAHQRMLYMDKTELIYHIILNVLLWGVSYVAINIYLKGNKPWQSLLFAAAIARTISFVFINNFWNSMLRSFSWVPVAVPGKKKEYLVKLQKRAQKCSGIEGTLLFGSAARGEMKRQSDIDIRFIRKKGFKNIGAAFLFITGERLRALFQRIPLDSYMGDTLGFLDKMDRDDIPVIIKDETQALERKYKTAITLSRYFAEKRSF